MQNAKNGKDIQIMREKDRFENLIRKCKIGYSSQLRKVSSLSLYSQKYFKPLNQKVSLTDRQTDRHANKQADRETDMQTDKQTNGWINRQKDGQISRQTERQIDEWCDRQKDGRTDRNLDR